MPPYDLTNTQVLYKDLDGTLTGLDGGGWALPNSELVPPELCTASVPAFSNYTAINGSVCSREVNFLRMAWNRAEPLVSCCYDTVIIMKSKCVPMYRQHSKV